MLQYTFSPKLFNHITSLHVMRRCVEAVLKTCGQNRQFLSLNKCIPAEVLVILLRKILHAMYREAEILLLK